MTARNRNLRYLIVVALVLATTLFLHARGTLEKTPQYEKLSSFPLTLGNWLGRDTPIGDDVREILGPGEFLSRIYTDSRSPYIDFFVGYFPSQKTGDTMHSPKNCLPGAGWTFAETKSMELPISNAGSALVNRFVLVRGTERLLVLYWYQAHGRVVANEYWAKIYLVTDAIRMNRTDGALVRVITPIAPGENADSAALRAASFATTSSPYLSRFIPE